MHIYTIDFTVKGCNTGMEISSSFRVRADLLDMAVTIFYDALSQMFPAGKFYLWEVGRFQEV